MKINNLPDPVKTIVTQRGEYRIYKNHIGRYTIMKVHGDNMARVSSADTQEEALAEVLLKFGAL